MTSPEPRPRRTEIEGLRGLAVLLVVGFHAGVSALSGAFVAVDVFFVLSGFFLTTSLIRQLVTNDAVPVREILARRIWRLLPALVVVLTATLVMTMLLYAPIDRAAAANNIAPAAAFVSNLAFAAGGVNYFHAGANPVLHTWTLGVEWQLALAFPALIAALAWFGARRAGGEVGPARRMIVMQTVFVGILVTGAISFAIATWINTSAPMWAYFGTHARLWTFAAGGMMAFLVGGGRSLFGASVPRANAIQMIGLAAIFVPALLYDRSQPYPGALALAPVSGTMLLVSAGFLGGETMVGRVLSSRPLAWLGRMSYAWYLWHWPLIVLGGMLLPSIGVGGRLAWAAVGLVLAVLTQRVIDDVEQRGAIARVMRGRPLLYAAALCLSLVAVATFAAGSSKRAVANSVHATFAAARSDRMHHECWASSARDLARDECAFGDVTSTTTVALLGDSHAEHWLGALDRAGKQHGWRIELHVMGGCPVPDFSGLTSGAATRRYRECNRYREAALAHLVAQKPDAVILSNFDSYIDIGDGRRIEYRIAADAWTQGLRRTYARLSTADIPVVVIRGTPLVPFDVPACLSRREARLPFARSCTFTPDRSFMARAQDAQNVAARGLNVRFVDMNDQVCEQPCRTMRGNTVKFTDDNHLTANFSRSLGAVLGERVAAVMPALISSSSSVMPAPASFSSAALRGVRFR